MERARTGLCTECHAGEVMYVEECDCSLKVLIYAATSNTPAVE